MYVLPIPSVYIEALISFRLSDKHLSLYINMLSNQSLASLLAVANVGMEKLCFPENRITTYDINKEYERQLFEIQRNSLSCRNNILEKSCKLSQYLEEGLKVAISLGYPFIDTQDYWEMRFQDNGPSKETIVPNVNIAECSVSFESESIHSSSLYTFQTPVAPTSEQEQIIEEAVKLLDGNTLKAQAFAGSGKTTLCGFIADNCTGKTLYLAFNKTMIEHGKHKLGHNDRVSCSTIDSLAFRLVKPWERWSEERLDRNYKNNWSLIADCLGLPKKMNNLYSGAIARNIDATVSNYCNSADTIISPSHIPQGPWSEGIEDEVLRWSQNHFDMIMSPNGIFPIKPHHVMKFWNLSGGCLPSEFEMILLDEAQDINPVFIDILQRSNNPRTLIGDHHQQLYKWRGAVNAFSNFDGNNFDLTKSFRFGCDLATYANRILATKKEAPSSYIVGNEGISTQVITYSPSNPRIEWPVSVILGRTNAQIFNQSFEIAKRGHRLHVVGGLDEVKYQLLDALRLYSKQFDKISHPDIRRFRSWDDLIVIQEMTNDPELYRIRKLIEEHGFALENYINTINRCYETDERRAPNILSTTHKVKGREWDSVLLLNDFISPLDLDRLSLKRRDEELNILYVAATRARRMLYIPNSHTFD
jgi:F-box protein, helicase, 18